MRRVARTLGGSSSINGHIYKPRASGQDFQHLGRNSANRGWGYPDVLPYFQNGWSGASARAKTPIAGRDGNLTVTTMDWRDPLCEAFMAGRDEPGYSAQSRFTTARSRRASPTPSAPFRTALRVSAATAFLHPARKRPNVHVRTHAPRHQHHLRRQARRRRALPQRRQGRCAHRSTRQQGKSFCRAAPIIRRRCCNCPGVGSPELLQSLGIEGASRRCRASAKACRIITRRVRSRRRQEHQDHQRTQARIEPVGRGR